ncbi:hypothetical protein ACJ73_08045, partial [Blastomyces percursus]
LGSLGVYNGYEYKCTMCARVKMGYGIIAEWSIRGVNDVNVFSDPTQTGLIIYAILHPTTSARCVQRSKILIMQTSSKSTMNASTTVAQNTTRSSIMTTI